MLAKMRALRVALTFSGVLFSILFLFSSNVFAVADGCSASFPTCFASTPADWSSGQCTAPSGSGLYPNGCTLPNNSPGQACCSTANPTPAVKSTIDDAKKWCGTIITDGTGKPACNYSFAATQVFSSCGTNTLGADCCQNGGSVAGQGSALCAKYAEYKQTKEFRQANVDFDLCKQTKDDAKCTSCFASKGIWTAVGCVNWNYSGGNGIAATAIKLGLGIGGGVVLIMILAGAFKLTTSKGDPKATEEAKEMITNAIGGLLFILFSIVIVRTIGVGLLQIPGF